MSRPAEINVTVAYALPERQWLWPLRLPQGSTVAEAISASPFPQRFPQLTPQDQGVGIFSKPCALSQVLRDGDRVEIYRPLLCDPKETRRQRARGA